MNPRLKVVFYIEDVATGKEILEKKQYILEFDQDAFEQARETIRTKLPDVTPEQIETLAKPLVSKMIREQIEAAPIPMFFTIRQAIINWLKG